MQESPLKSPKRLPKADGSLPFNQQLSTVRPIYDPSSPLPNQTSTQAQVAPPSGSVPTQKVGLVHTVQKVISPPQIPYPQVYGPTYQANIDPNCVGNTLQNLYNSQMNPMNLMYNYPLHLSSTSDLDTMSSRDIVRRKKLKALYAEYRKIKHDAVSESDAKYSEYRKRKHELKKKIKKYES
jgi:hypothetical protein